MNRYDFLIYESRQGEASIEAESPKEARDKLMELYKAGGIEFTFVTGTDNEILNITPLKAVPLQRFEIFGKEALFTDLPADKVDALQGTDKLYRYDLRHGDDDSIPLKVQPEVTVNRYGTVFTAEPLFMESEFSRDLYDEDWGFLSDEPPMTPEQFYSAIKEKERQTVREYEIYQLNAGGRDHMFMNMKELRAMRVTPNIASYDAVYKGTLEPGMTLDSLYTKFNVEKPEDFKGHSLSVSDVIVVSDEHGKTAWFVDSFGFTQLPDFFTQQEQQHEAPTEGEKVQAGHRKGDQPGLRRPVSERQRHFHGAGCVRPGAPVLGAGQHHHDEGARQLCLWQSCPRQRRGWLRPNRRFGLRHR